jgi:hypothetical protein
MLRSLPDRDLIDVAFPPRRRTVLAVPRFSAARP